VERVGQQEPLVVVGEIGGGLQPERERAIAGAILGERFELHDQRRHHVEGDAHVGKLPQQRHHAVVVLQPMQPDPGEDVFAGHQILVERLVHVPEERDLRHLVV
jgi:hypothetical protein